MNVRKLRLSMLLVTLLLTFILAPTGFAASPPPPDLQTDRNRDGVPDELALAVAEIATARDTEVAVAELLARIPYQKETYALQEEAARLNRQLAEARTAEEATRIHRQLLDVAAKMEQDPAYTTSLRAVEKLYAEQGIMVEEGVRSTHGAGLQAVNWGNLQAGDVMLVRSGKFPWTAFIYAMTYSHTGNYNGSNLVYESNADGVRLKPLSNWQQSGQYIALGRSNRRSIAQVQGALSWARAYYGTDGSTPYNYWYPDKNTNSRLYCSQLTWKIHNHLGVNVDSNAWRYQLWIGLKWGAWAIPAVAIPAVAPDEVGLDGDIHYYSKSWN
ncbi:MAG: YiiX/YebB-like N1pC/P60 family cysteine hydrolase [Anaerolineales bacterium]